MQRVASQTRISGRPDVSRGVAHEGGASDDRLHPSIRDRNYLHLAPISRVIEETLRTRLDGNTLRVLDLGCGSKPYEPLFRERSASYLGVDVHRASAANVLAAGGHLPFREESFDVVVCTQVLEHDPTPERTVLEACRVLVPGGLLILTTHGVWFKHGEADYWRWTDAGLRLIMRPFKDVQIHNCGGQYSALFQILNLYADPLPIGRRFLYLLNNMAGLALDRILPSENLIINYVVVAQK